MKTYKYKINGTDYAVMINSLEDEHAEVTVNGVEYKVEFDSMAQVKAPKAIQHVSAVPSTDTHPAVARTAVPSTGAHGVKSPLPGVILSMMVQPGDYVKVGQRLLVLEAMKMENNIDSDREGVIKSINVQKGDSVLEGAVLLTIE